MHLTSPQKHISELSVLKWFSHKDSPGCTLVHATDFFFPGKLYIKPPRAGLSLPQGYTDHVLCQGDTPRCSFKVANPGGSQLGVVSLPGDSPAIDVCLSQPGGLWFTATAAILKWLKTSGPTNTYNALDSPHNQRVPCPKCQEGWG